LKSVDMKRQDKSYCVFRTHAEVPCSSQRPGMTVPDGSVKTQKLPAVRILRSVCHLMCSFCAV
jgi:hypothetical protein